MRIIKEGKIKEKIKKCFNCSTKMAYKKSDINLNMDFNEYIICPICKQHLLTSIFDKKVKK